MTEDRTRPTRQPDWSQGRSSPDGWESTLAGDDTLTPLAIPLEEQGEVGWEPPLPPAARPARIGETLVAASRAAPGFVGRLAQAAARRGAEVLRQAPQEPSFPLVGA